MLSTDTNAVHGYLDVPPYRLDYLYWGNGAPELVGLHGFGGSCRSFAALGEYVQKHGDKPFLSLSLPHHGESTVQSGQPDSYSLNTFAESLHSALTKLGVEQTALVAHSFGARLALASAVRFPDFYRHLYLIAAGGFYPWEERLFALFHHPALRWTLNIDWLAILLMKVLMPGASREKRKDHLPAVRHLAAHFPNYRLKQQGILHRLVTYPHKIDLIWGQNDHLVPASFAYDIKQHFRDAEVHEIADAGHIPMVQKTKEVGSIILS